jgi:hypothetical protein
MAVDVAVVPGVSSAVAVADAAADSVAEAVADVAAWAVPAVVDCAATDAVGDDADVMADPVGVDALSPEPL